MSRYDLLPPNATKLERDFVRSISSLERVKPAETEKVYATGVFVEDVFAAQKVFISIRTAKRINIPSSVVPWLIYEYGLGEILPYLGDNQRRALAEGVLWQRIRGTPAAVRIALSWIGIQGLINESEGGSTRWAEYQLGLAAATSGEQIIDDITAVTRLSSPVRSRLQRIYAVYDFRRFVLDSSLLSGGDMLSDHSGVRPRPGWPQISYGRPHAGSAQCVAAASGCHTRGRSALVELSDRFILSQSILDDDWHTINHPSLLSRQKGMSGQYSGQVWGAFQWQPLPWGTVNVVASSTTTRQTS